jgi:integrase
MPRVGATAPAKDLEGNGERVRAAKAKEEQMSKVDRNAIAAPRKDPTTGKWWFIVDTGIGADGKRHQAKRRGFVTKNAAKEELTKIRRSVDTQTFVPPSQQKLGEYLDQWLKGLPTAGLRPSTIDGYRRCLLYLTPALRSRRVDKLTASDLDVFYSDLLASGRRQKEGGLSPRSVRYVHVVIQKALGDAVRKGELARNVATVASPPSAKSTRAPEMNWWTPEQLRSFLSLTGDEPLGPLFRVAAMTGMRRGEVCGLRWSDVDLEKGRIEVRQQLLALGGELSFSERTKTDHGRRRIDLDPVTVAVLKSQKARQAGDRLALGPGYTDNGLVFAQPDGSPVDPESVAKVFERRVAKSTLPRIRFHDLRHTHVAHLIAAGEQPLLIAKRLGHSSSAFTMDRYGHLFETADSQAASAVAQMVDGATGLS